MKRHNIYFLPVYSAETGKICGVLDLIDLLKAGFPEYVFRLNNLSMLKEFQPLDYFWKHETTIPIGQYLRDYRPYIIKDSITYPEIFFMLVKGHRRHLLVVDEHDEMIGVINPHEIINKMLRP
jgi:CBS domain containing-hemolysin-like protein